MQFNVGKWSSIDSVKNNKYSGKPVLHHSLSAIDKKMQFGSQYKMT